MRKIFFIALVALGIIRKCAMLQAPPMTRSQAIKAKAEEFNLTNFSKIRYFLYTKSNPTEAMELDMDDPETLARSTFNSQNPTRLMIHGWNDAYDRSSNSLIRESLLLNGEKTDYNFISVDWRVYSTNKNYILVQKQCSIAGTSVAEFIDWMHDNANLSFATLTLYGHSLGAHVAGFCGKSVRRGKIHTIIGLDPAMALFPHNSPEQRLADTDAEYVESIHSNGGRLGFYKPIGQIAFYPNGGKLQPGCGIDLSGLCSHIRAVELLSEALRTNENNQFYAIGCSKLDNIKDTCCNRYTARARLGHPNNVNSPKGIYYLETNSESPFAIGSSVNGIPSYIRI